MNHMHYQAIQDLGKIKFILKAETLLNQLIAKKYKKIYKEKMPNWELNLKKIKIELLEHIIIKRKFILLCLINFNIIFKDRE